MERGICINVGCVPRNCRCLPVFGLDGGMEVNEPTDTSCALAYAFCVRKTPRGGREIIEGLIMSGFRRFPTLQKPLHDLTIRTSREPTFAVHPHLGRTLQSTRNPRLIKFVVTRLIVGVIWSGVSFVASRKLSVKRFPKTKPLPRTLTPCGGGFNYYSVGREGRRCFLFRCIW